MRAQSCCGKDAFTGAAIEVVFHDTVQSVTPAPEPTDLDLYLAPGFIDLQVNGFAAVDYNHPHTTFDSIARSLRAQVATGVTRLYPTVITGAPDEMLACLRTLAAARR